MMRMCNRCGGQLVDRAKYCHQCGIPVLGKYSFINDKRTNVLASVIKEVEDLKEKVKDVVGENKRLTDEISSRNNYVSMTTSEGNLTLTGINSATQSSSWFVSDSENLNLLQSGD